MWYMAAAMTMVVYGSGDDDGGIWQLDTTMQPQIEQSKYRKDYAKAQIGSDKMN